MKAPLRQLRVSLALETNDSHPAFRDQSGEVPIEGRSYAHIVAVF